MIIPKKRLSKIQFFFTQQRGTATVLWFLNFLRPYFLTRALVFSILLFFHSSSFSAGIITTSALTLNPISLVNHRPIKNVFKNHAGRQPSGPVHALCDQEQSRLRNLTASSTYCVHRLSTGLHHEETNCLVGRYLPQLCWRSSRSESG